MSDAAPFVEDAPVGSAAAPPGPALTAEDSAPGPGAGSDAMEVDAPIASETPSGPEPPASPGAAQTSEDARGSRASSDEQPESNDGAGEDAQEPRPTRTTRSRAAKPVASSSGSSSDGTAKKASRPVPNRAKKAEPVYYEPELAEATAEGDEELASVTRCVCGQETSPDLANEVMFQCDGCGVWQHGPCIGLWTEEDCPGDYYCEICKPTWHGPGGIVKKHVAFKKFNVKRQHQERRQRNTMNSRDAAYDEEIALQYALEASKEDLDVPEGDSGDAGEATETVTNGTGQVPARAADEGSPAPEEPPVKPEEPAAQPPQEPAEEPAKRKIEDIPAEPTEQAPPPKTRRTGGHRTPSKRSSSHAAPHRNENVESSNNFFTNRTTNDGGASLPEHLKHLENALPKTLPKRLVVPHFVFDNHDAMTLKFISEPSTKIKYPSRRVTLQEMRKRSRSMVEFLSRMQIENSLRSVKDRYINAAVGKSVYEQSIQGLREYSQAFAPHMQVESLEAVAEALDREIDSLSRDILEFQNKYFDV